MDEWDFGIEILAIHLPCKVRRKPNPTTETGIFLFAPILPILPWCLLVGVHKITLTSEMYSVSNKRSPTEVRNSHTAAEASLLWFCEFLLTLVLIHSYNDSKKQIMSIRSSNTHGWTVKRAGFSLENKWLWSDSREFVVVLVSPSEMLAEVFLI